MPACAGIELKHCWVAFAWVRALTSSTYEPTFSRGLSWGRYRGGSQRTLAEVLIVKDEPLIALDLCEALSAAAASIVAAISASDALRLTWQGDISAGVVDVELGTDDCDRVRHSLISEEIPFVFYAAYSDPLVRHQRPTAPAIANAGDMLLIVEAIARRAAPAAPVADRTT